MGTRISDMLKKRENLMRLGIFLLTFLFIFIVLSTSLVTTKYNLKEGDIAKVDIKAQREVEDVAATEERRLQASNSVPLQYNKRTEVMTEALDKINGLFSIREASAGTAALKNQTDFALTDAQAGYLLELSAEEAGALQNLLVTTLTELYENRNISDSTQSGYQSEMSSAQEFVKERIGSSALSGASGEIALQLALSEIRPNFFYDQVKTEEMKKQAADEVSTVLIKKGQIIVKEGEPVTGYQISILEDLGLLNSEIGSPPYLYVVLGMLVLLVMAIQWYYLFSLHYEVFCNNRKLIMINLLGCTAVVIARTTVSASAFFIPLAFIPMVFTIAVNHRISMASSLLNCILISVAVNFDIEITLLAVANAFVGSLATKRHQQRNEILYASAAVAAINLVMAFSLGLLLSNNVSDLGQKAFHVIAASLISGVLTIGFLPFLEHLFGIVTTTKLLELSNPNSPLLKKLLMEAPGTYHHSVLVGNLAEHATEAVGGNPVFVRVCAYYHDVGKLKRPYFFKENQLENDNPHDKISPNLSTQIIISHVKDGVELAREHKIPEEIINVIEQHHGTSLAKYFYITVRNSSDKPTEINESDYRYKGPAPKTKEAGILMLADAVEAAVRSLSEPSKEKIEAMVDSIIKSRLDDRQLDNCDLTFSDIEKIKDAFLTVFNGIYHSRIEYPEDKWA
ncbi:MAG: family phosphohydrolase [Firmicutes bacterium]|nr:family phosphohydrolase [Bacillota bacterium]